MLSEVLGVGSILISMPIDVSQLVCKLHFHIFSYCQYIIANNRELYLLSRSTIIDPHAPQRMNPLRENNLPRLPDGS